MTYDYVLYMCEEFYGAFWGAYNEEKDFETGKADPLWENRWKYAIFSKSLGRKKYFFKEEAEKIDFLKCDKLRV